MSRFTLPRRAFLRGLGGFGIALPALEIMSAGMGGGRALAAATAPKRFVFMYGGISTGRGVRATATSPTIVRDLLVPTTVGANYELTEGLKTLGPLNIKDQITVVSKLKVPWQEQGGTVPTAGRQTVLHYGSVVPQLTGIRQTSAANPSNLPGPTADAVAAQALAGNSKFASLVYRAQVDPYIAEGSMPGRISWRKDATGKLVINEPTVSPQVAFNSLFGNFTAPGAEEAAKAAFLLKQRKSVLDLARVSTQELISRVGSQDKDRLTRHFDEIRDLELRIGELTPPEVASCTKPASPGADPTVNAVRAGWSNEDLRAKLLADLIYYGMVCDLSRVASLQLTFWKCHMGAKALVGRDNDFHDNSHSATISDTLLDNLTPLVAWHIKHFGYLAAKLKSATDVDGKRLIDHTAMVLTFEGGHGYSPEAPTGIGGPHSTENMTCLIAGGSAGGLKPGRHVVAKDKHPVNVINSAFKACGLPAKHGEVTGEIPALFA